MCIHQPSLWKIQSIYGVQQWFITVFHVLYNNSSCCIKTATSITSFFTIASGVRWGCILSTIMLFIVVIDYVMLEAMDSTDFSSWWRNHLTIWTLQMILCWWLPRPNHATYNTTCKIAERKSGWGSVPRRPKDLRCVPSKMSTKDFEY